MGQRKNLRDLLFRHKLQAAKRFVRLSQNDLCDFHVY